MQAGTERSSTQASTAQHSTAQARHSRPLLASMLPVSGAEQLKHSGAHTLRPISSAQCAYSAAQEGVCVGACQLGQGEGGKQGCI